MLVTSACSSSRMTVSRSAKKRSASGAERRSAACSGVVSRMSGGLSFWRWRLWSGVSPVRVSRRTAQAHLGDRLLRGCGRCRRRAPSAARRRACGCRGRRPARCRRPLGGGRPGSAGSRRASCRRRSARSGGSSGRARLLEQLDLVRPRRPAARGEPVRKRAGRRPSVSDTVSFAESPSVRTSLIRLSCSTRMLSASRLAGPIWGRPPSEGAAVPTWRRSRD